MFLQSEAFAMPNRVFLTFDLEDFINNRSISTLYLALKLLEKSNIRALFFITGHMAERLSSYPKIIDLLDMHEIGFPSTSHSVRPTIFEYCDVEKCEDAFSNTIERETAHINPLSGKIEGKGGIYALRDLFPSKDVCAYRAPGYSCPPPHLRAMASLGIKYDFSMSLSRIPVWHEGTTFFPLPVFLDCETALLGSESTFLKWAIFLRSVFMREVTVLNFHLDRFVNKDWWDSIFHKGNPAKLSCVSEREDRETRRMFMMTDLLLKMVSRLEKLRVIDTSPIPYKAEIQLDVNKVNIEETINKYAYWPRMFFGYSPKYAASHFSMFLT
jgi:hypothetical protein